MDKGGGEEGEGEMNGDSSMDAYTLIYVNRQPMGICCMTQGTQPGFCNNLDGVGMGERWEGDSYVHLWLIHVDV